jgi:hypothetical protein
MSFDIFSCCMDRNQALVSCIAFLLGIFIFGGVHKLSEIYIWSMSIFIAWEFFMDDPILFLLMLDLFCGSSGFEKGFYF